MSKTLAVATVLSSETFTNGSAADAAASTCTNWNTLQDLTGKYAASADTIGKDGYEKLYYSSETVTVNFDIADKTSVTIGDGKLMIDKDTPVKLVNGEEYGFTLSPDSKAKYGATDVSSTFKVDSKTTSFTVSASTE